MSAADPKPALRPGRPGCEAGQARGPPPGSSPGRHRRGGRRARVHRVPGAQRRPGPVGQARGLPQDPQHGTAAGLPAQRAGPGAEAAPDRGHRVRHPAAAQPDLGAAPAGRAAAGRRSRLRGHDHGGARGGRQAARRLPLPGRGEPRGRPAAGHHAAERRARPGGARGPARVREPAGARSRPRRGHGRARRGAAVPRSRGGVRPPQRGAHRRAARRGHRRTAG